MIHQFNSLLQKIQSRNLVEEAYQIASQRYYLNPYQISDIQPYQARQIYTGIIQKYFAPQNRFYKGNNHQNSRNWLFIWTLICYLYLNGSGLEEMGEEDWNLFSQIFPKKDPQLFQYQSQALFKNKIKVKDRIWQNEESEILTQIMNKQNEKVKWNEVSKELYFTSNKAYFRTAKQCRERWLNHLDPSKKKGKWTADQCLIMFEHVKQYGKKWAQLVKKLGQSRNEHTIKNKFNSLLKKQKKQNQKASEEEIYEIIIMRIRNAIKSNISQKPTEITFDIEDIPSSSHNISQSYEKIQKKQNQPIPPTSSFSFDNMLRKIKNFKHPKQKPLSSITSIITKPSQVKNIKEQNESEKEEDLKSPALFQNFQNQNEFEQNIRSDSEQYLEDD